MQPLIDADILLYEVGYRSQNKDESGEIIPDSWEVAQKKWDDTIANICAEVYATEPPILFFTGEGNFRDAIAHTRPYKGNRKPDKPFHYSNLRAYAAGVYDCRCTDGLEADDLLSICQRDRLGALDTIICSRDKDLRIVPGMHFSWEVKGSPRFGPTSVKRLGTLQLQRGGKKLFGTGLRFFYSQCLTGDKVDNIPGIRGYGPVKVFNTLKDCGTVEELEQTVLDIYIDKFGEGGKERMLEVGRLLWMTAELNEDGSPVLWEFNNGDI